MDWIIMIIRDLYASKFFGEVIIKFESGKVVQVKKHISLLPPKDA
jgi:hypothetical protein